MFIKIIELCIKLLDLIYFALKNRDIFFSFADLVLKIFEISVIIIIAVIGFLRYKPELVMGDKYRIARSLLTKFHELTLLIKQLRNFSLFVNLDNVSSDYMARLLSEYDDKINHIYSSLVPLKIEAEIILDINIEEVFIKFDSPFSLVVGSLQALKPYYQAISENKVLPLTEEGYLYLLKILFLEKEDDDLSKELRIGADYVDKKLKHFIK